MINNSFLKQLVLLLGLFLLITPFLHAQNKEANYVKFNQDTLFSINSNIGAFSAKQRAEMVTKNIQQLSKLPLSQFDSLKIITNATGTDIIYQERVITTVTQQDAIVENTTSEALALEHLVTIKQVLVKDYNDNSWETLAQDFGLFFLSLLIFILVFKSVNRIFDYLRTNLKTLKNNYIFRSNRFIGLFHLITPETEKSILLFLLRMLRFTVLGLFFYLYLPYMFSQISYTRGFGEQLLNYVLVPLKYMADGFRSYLPKLLFILIIVIAVRYIIRGLSVVANQVKQKKISISGFYPDWAIPTLNLMRALIIIFTLVIIFPYLPGAGSDAFQGVSVFVGLLLSLGSAGAISNVISGVILTYMRPFQAGDRVKLNDVTGDIITKNLLVTKIKTLKNEEITVPNSTLLNGGIVNYTTLAEKHGLIIYTSVTIGYDVPWKQVHQLLIDAAKQTKYIEIAPEPYVLQKSLDDWYVGYELNAYTKESHKIPSIYSQLHGNIQDVFNEAGVEIMSSHYLTLRDGNQTTIPNNYLSKDYEVPSFRIKNQE